MAGMSTPARTYHHGNLRAVLLTAAAEEIQAVGAAQLSLRELARRAGVSHAAPAHHFRDKRGLFTALAADGFHLLHQRTTPTLRGDAALAEAGMRYVEFALAYPSHFTVMFDNSLLDADDAALVRERGKAFDVLFEAVRAATGVAEEDDLLAQTLTAWAVVHGLATLWLTGNLPYGRDPDEVARVFHELAPALVSVAVATNVQLPSGTHASPSDKPKKGRS